MGGDNAPAEIIKGVVNAVQNNPDLSVTLVGREDVIKSHLPEPASSRISILNAEEVIETGEDPLIAIRRKKNSSMLMALDLLKQKQVDACVSAGSTGAFMSGALFGVGRIKGIQRPALAPIMPTLTGNAILIDCGANADCKPEFILQFAQMGSIYMNRVMGIDRPRVGLLNIGAEEEKGNAVYKEAHQLLKHSAQLNFVGNVEGRDALDGNVDVIACDGFGGNIFLKTTEGTATMLFTLLKKELTASLSKKLAAAVLKPGLKNLKKKLDYNEQGGALLLGIDGVAVKAHGSSNAKAFESALRQAKTAVEKDVVGSIRQSLIAALETE
jgi:glycerol-3-phosphate acyltransferase PlsX